jgi:hypothetical protein
VLEDIPLGPHIYKRPANVDEEKLDDELKKLYEFFKAVHYSLWEMRTRLSIMYDHLNKKVGIETIGHYALLLKQVKEVVVVHMIFIV